MKKAIVPGSFDPVTAGHVDVIRRAARIFDEVHTGVMVNAEKQNSGMFTPSERLSILESAVRDIKGVKCALCTDHPEVPQNYLMLSAALAAREGISDVDALAMITINAAEIAGIETRVGSIEVGKDADFVLYDGHPFDIRSKVRGVWIDGERIV